MAYPTDVVATGDLITAAQINRWCVMLADSVLDSPAATFDLTSIPAHWSHLKLVAYLRGDSASVAVPVYVRFNNDASAIYDRQALVANAATVTGSESISNTSAQIGNMPDSSGLADSFGVLELTIPYYAGTTDLKSASSIGGHKRDNSTGNVYVEQYSVHWRSAAAINRITLLPSSGNFDTGSRVSLYGTGRI